MTNHQFKYPLLPYSQLVWEMTRWLPGVYRFPMTFLWRGGASEKDRIERAVYSALENHPVFAMRVDRNGMHSASEVKDVLSGKYHSIILLDDNEDVIIQANLSRILGDGKSMEILLEDVERAYEGLPLEQDDYWGYVARCEQSKTSAHYEASHDWLRKEFADESMPVRPSIDRRWLATMLPPKAGVYEEDYTALHENLERLREAYFISYEGIFSLSAALAIADYCGTEEAALTWAYEGRETESEQHIYGSLHRDIPFLIKVNGEGLKVKGNLIRQARDQIRFGIAHSDYPYTLTAPYNKRWNNAVNVLRVDDAEAMLRKTSLPIEVVSIPKQKYAYALLDVEIHEHHESLQLVYRYSATHYKESSIRKFATLVRKYVEWLID